MRGTTVQRIIGNKMVIGIHGPTFLNKQAKKIVTDVKVMYTKMFAIKNFHRKSPETKDIPMPVNPNTALPFGSNPPTIVPNNVENPT